MQYCTLHVRSYDLQHSEDIKIYGINDQDNDAWNASSSNDKEEAG